MKHLKQYTIIGIIFVLIAGTFAHFLYDWSGNNHIVGLFTPINESIWEHMKLLFFPMLIYSLIIIFRFRNTYSCAASALYFGIIVGTLLIPLFFYAYTTIHPPKARIFEYPTVSEIISITTPKSP